MFTSICGCLQNNVKRSRIKLFGLVTCSSGTVAAELHGLEEEEADGSESHTVGSLERVQSRFSPSKEGGSVHLDAVHPSGRRQHGVRQRLHIGAEVRGLSGNSAP